MIIQNHLRLIVAISLFAMSSASANAQSQPTSQPIDEKIATLISQLGGSYPKDDLAVKALTAIGEPAVPALLHLALDAPGSPIRRGDTPATNGRQVGAALPKLLEVAKSKATSASEKSRRQSALSILQGMPWAADEIIPVFKQIADDPTEDEATRTWVLSDLRDMGKAAIPILRPYAEGSAGKLRETARSTLADILQKEGVQTRHDYYAAIIDSDLFAPEVPDYLERLRDWVHPGRPDPLTEKVKAAYRSRLNEKSDGELALKLAQIIQNQLGAPLEWAAPTDSGSGSWAHESRSENYNTMAQALGIGFQHADEGSAIRQTIGIGLAKLRLLQGDWDKMNQVLTEMGWSEIPAEARPFLAAPPVKWSTNLRQDWTQSDPEMRSGDCGLVFHIEKDGKGMAGAHVLVKKYLKSKIWMSGISTDTLFWQPQPIARFMDSSFGYGAKDRPMTRYAITDATGNVKFEKLPLTEIKIEVLIPTANFVEPRAGWDLWMEVAPGELKRAAVFGGPDTVKWDKPPAVAQLKAGETVRYPRLVVLPQVDLQLDDWTKADPHHFEVEWSPLPHKPADQVTYELEMILTAPSHWPDFPDNNYPIQTSKEILHATRWDIATKGVGGTKLSPGNIYALGLIARDSTGQIVGRSPHKRIWVDWENRKAKPPITTGSDTYNGCPVEPELYYSGNIGYGDGRSETLQERVARFLHENPTAFEHEYVQLTQAWLAWHAGHSESAEAQFKTLLSDLPRGCIPSTTAELLLKKLQAGASPPKSLKLVGPTPSAPTTSPNPTNQQD